MPPMLTRTSEYALRAMIYLAQNESEWPIIGADVAAATSIPAKYLSKILGDLVRVGVLESTPGRRGGFRFVNPAKKTKLYDVLAPFEHLEQTRCPFGNALCSDENPCLAHDRWKRVLATHKRFLQGTAIYDVAVGTHKQRRHTQVRKK